MGAEDRDDPRPRHRDDPYDDYDDLPPDRRRRPRRRGDDGVAKLIPYRNWAALTAYYCGIFGLIPVLGFVLGPLAFIFGIMGFVAARKNPEAHGTGHAIAGIILGLIAPVLWIAIYYFFVKPT